MTGEALLVLVGLWLLFRGSSGPAPTPPAPRPPPPPGVSPWSDDDMRAFIETVNPIVGATVFALNVYQVESGNDPRAKNAKSGNVGLPQIDPKYLPNFGWTAGPEAFRLSGVRGQLPVIGGLLLGQVKQIGRRPETVAELYHANFYPATLGKAYVVRNKANGGSVSEDAAYRFNAGLDSNRDGVITEADLDNVLTKARANARYRALAAQMVRLAGEETAPHPGSRLLAMAPAAAPKR